MGASPRPRKSVDPVFAPDFLRNLISQSVALALAVGLVLLVGGCVAASRDMTCGGFHMASDKSVGETMRARVQRPATVPTDATYSENIAIVVRPSSFDVAMQTSVNATCKIPASP